jgi:hypothetical protein
MRKTSTGNGGMFIRVEETKLSKESASIAEVYFIVAQQRKEIVAHKNALEQVNHPKKWL